MTLFNVCNWWSTQCPDLDENYDDASLLCARFGLEDQEKDYIVVGSHGGHLSIYYPCYDVNIESPANAYRATDLIFEQKCNAPILGVYAGRFSANNRKENTNQLVILHPYSVVIYNLKILKGFTEHGMQIRLQLLQEYSFVRAAFALCRGYFGRVKGREFFCITHLDGCLTFFEQDGIVYECRFPGQNGLPTPVVYSANTDSFFRMDPAWNLQCFTYQDLSQSSAGVENCQPVWSVCIGEDILNMSVVRAKSEYASIMILGERNFLSITDAGRVEFILKLDYLPKCSYSFVIGYYWEPAASLITIITSVTSKLFIYNKAQIIWAANYQYESPIAIRRSNLNGLPGALITLSSKGNLHIGYLGSDPYVFEVAPFDSNQMNFNDALEEYKQLEQEIKDASDLQNMDAINKSCYKDLNFSFSISDKIQLESDDLLLEDVAADVALKELASCKGQLEWQCSCDLSEMQIILNMPEGIRCTQEAVSYVNIEANRSEHLEMEFYIAELLHLYTAKVEATVSFLNTKGIPRVIQKSAYLPLEMFFKMKPSQQITADIKLTYYVKDAIISLQDYFPEFIPCNEEVQSLSLLSFTTTNDNCEEIITIAISKDSNCLSLQSDTLATFPLVLERLIIKASNCKLPEAELSKKSEIQCKILEPLIPFENVLQTMDEHYETQLKIRQHTFKLDELWQRFKELQRELKGNSADETSTEDLSLQIEENYEQLINMGDKLMEIRQNELRQRSRLSCSITTIKLIIKSLELNQKLINLITSVLSTPVEDWTDMSWEELVAPGLDMLNHYGPLNCWKTINFTTTKEILSCNSKESNFEYIHFRRNFSVLFERILSLAAKSELGDKIHMEIRPSEKTDDAKSFDLATKSVESVNELENEQQKEEEELIPTPKILNVQPATAKVGNIKVLKPYQSGMIVEAVYDDDYDDVDRDSNRKDTSEVLNDPCLESEKVFNNLGIW